MRGGQQKQATGCERSTRLILRLPNMFSYTILESTHFTFLKEFLAFNQQFYHLSVEVI